MESFSDACFAKGDFTKGKKYMKKAIGLLLAAVMACGVLSPCQSVFAADANRKSVAAFSKSVNRIVSEYDGDEDYALNQNSTQLAVEDRILVYADKLSKSYGEIEKVSSSGVIVLQFADDASAASALKSLSADGYSADYDLIARTADVNATEYVSETWGNERVESQETINSIKSSGKKLNDVTVAVIDSGVDDTHPDLKNRVVGSIDFTNSDTEADQYGHGTQVAGVIVQNSPNNVKIKSYKIADSNGNSTMSYIVSALNTIASEQNAPKILNMSLVVNVTGDSTSTRNYFENVVSELDKKGCTIVSAAGNKNEDASSYFPASIPQVITVAASDSDNNKATYSNYGSVVDIAAPGTHIYTTIMGGGYTRDVSGTSLATPFVSAAAATLLSMDGSLKASQLESKIKSAAFPINDNTGTNWCGAGILNFSALYEDALLQSPVLSKSSGSYSSAITVSATAPSGTTVMYTTDNTVPTLTNGNALAGPVTLSKSTSLTAVAIGKNGKSKYIHADYDIKNADAGKTVLDVGSPAYVSVSSSSKFATLTFKPTQTANYVFESHSDDIKYQPHWFLLESTTQEEVQNQKTEYVGNECKTTVKLFAGTTYLLKCGAYYGSDIPSNATQTYSVSVEFATDAVKPSAPENFEVTGRGNGGRSLWLDWSDCKNAVSYKVYDVTNGANTFKGEVKTSDIAFHDFNPAWEYDIKVVAISSTGDTADATYRVCAACEPPTNFTISANGTYSLSASWNYVACHGYYLQWSTDPTFQTDKNGAWINGTFSTSYTINTSKPAKQYYVRVRCWKNYQGGYIYSDFTDSSILGYMDAPNGFAVTGRGNGGKSLWLDWNDVAGAVGYKVYDVTNGANTLKGDVKTSDIAFHDFNPAWEYDIKVVAYDKNGKTSNATYRVCAACEPPEIIVVMADDIGAENSISAAWDYVACHGYYIQWSTDPNFKTDVHGEWINGTYTTKFVKYVGPNAGDYYVRVRGWKNYQGGKIFSDFSEPVKAAFNFSASMKVTGRGNGGKSLWLDWRDVYGAAVYGVFDITDHKNTLKGSCYESQFTFTDLNPAWEYDFLVLAYDASGNLIAWGAAQNVCAACEPAKNLSVSVSGSNTITASWEYVACHGYYIQWSTDPTFTDKSKIQGAWINGTYSTNYTIKTSDSADKYYVRVRCWKNYQGGYIYSDFCSPVSAAK